MLHFIAGFLAGAAVGLPAGMWSWWKYGFGLKADAQKVVTEVTKFAGKAKASEK